MRKFVFAFCVGVMAATSSPAQDEPYKILICLRRSVRTIC